jgi:hypothetical protein
MILFAFGLFGCIMVAVLGRLSPSPPAQQAQPSSTPPPIAPASPARSPERIALDSIEVKNFEWVRGGFGTVAIAGFTIRNNGGTAVKDLTLACFGFAESGTKVDLASKVLYVKIGPRKRRHFAEQNLGLISHDVDKLVCRVVGLSLEP